MLWVVRASKKTKVRKQLMCVLRVNLTDINEIATLHEGVVLLVLNKENQSSIKSLRNIDATYVDQTTASALVNAENEIRSSFFNSLNSVSVSEQYEHLIQLIHIEKSKRNTCNAAQDDSFFE